MKNMNKIFALLMAAMLMISACIQPALAEAISYDTETGYPLLDMIHSQLDPEEIIIPNDVTLTADQDLNIIDPVWTKDKQDLLRVEMHSFTSVNGGSLQNKDAGDYTVYYVVTPASGHPAYEISRQIHITEPIVVEPITENAAEDTNDDSDEPSDADDSEDDSQQEEYVEPEVTVQPVEDEENVMDEPEDAVSEDIPAEITQVNTEEPAVTTTPVPDYADNTEDPMNTDDTSETVPSVFEEEINETEEEITETDDLPFSDQVELMSEADEEISESVDEQPDEEIDPDDIIDEDNIVLEGPATVDRGSKITYPSDLGSYSTRGYRVDGKVAYCLESAKSSPANGSYAQEILDTNAQLTKALYYGYGGPGDISADFFPNYSGNVRYILTHIAASYFYTGSYSSATKGCSSSGLTKYRVKEWIDYLEQMDNPPSPAISLSTRSLSVERIENGIQTTGETTLNADSRNSITLSIPDQVTYHNSTSGESQTGGEVIIYGGTSFYFSAPVSVTGSWNTDAMNGRIAQVWKVLVVATGTKTQHLGSYASESYGGSVRFSVDWNNDAELRLIKVDSDNEGIRLAGAQFGLFSDAACTDQIALMTTNDNGEAACSFSRVYPIVYLKELAAPQGYRINKTIYTVTVTDDPVITVMVKNNVQSAGLKITKKGEMLTDAIATENGVQFVYQTQRLSNAVFRVTADSPIYNTDGSLIYQRGSVVADNIITNADGEAHLNDLPLGTYIIEEIQAPAGYVLNTEKRTVVLEYAGQEADVAFDETTFINQRQKVDVNVTKADSVSRNPLAGAEFGLYADNSISNSKGEWIVNAGTLIETASSDQNGSIRFSADLPVGYAYSIREISAPAGYILSDESYAFNVTAADQHTETITVDHTFYDNSVSFVLELTKEDAQQQHAQADASLAGAVYGLYAREDIYYPDGKTGLLYGADALVTTITTDANGKGSVEGLHAGKYYLKELTPSTGYTLDETTYNVACSADRADASCIIVKCTVKEQVIRQPFQIIKAVDNGSTNAPLLEGAGFQAWLVSDLDHNNDGTYDFSSADPVILTADGRTEMYTDSTGHATSIPLPYGTYIVRETLTPNNYAPVDDFVVTISENNPSVPQVWRVLLDKEFSAKLQIVKIDADTGRIVQLPNAEFTIYNEETGTFVSQVTTYPQTTTHTSFRTDDSGTLILPEPLKPGRYRITETHAPDGYLLNPASVTVTVGDDTPYRIDGVSGDAIIEVVLSDRAAKGRIQIFKEGEMLSGFADGQFIFENRRLSGVTFEIRAAEDIYTADNQYKEDGSRYIEFAEGALICTLTTNADGTAITDDLPLGKYVIQEKETISGYVLDSAPHYVTLAYADQETEVVVEAASIENKRQRVQIYVDKLSEDGSMKLPGAVLGLYNANDIFVDGTVIVPAGTCLANETTDETGTAVFQMDLPLGQYLINELQAPAGYVRTDEVIEVTASYQGPDIEIAIIEKELKNHPVRIAISKEDATTGVELDGAQLTLMDTDGNVIETWTSVVGQPHIIEGLNIGSSYLLKEDIAPYGYLISNTIRFTVSDTAEIQKVIMHDDVPTGKIIINKSGEFLSGVTALDSVGGWASNAFNFITGSMSDVTFGVYAYENIRNADGASPDYYKADELISEIRTDASGIAVIENLPLGRYYVREIATQYGYVLDDQIRMIDLSYRDANTPVVTYSSEWQNERCKLIAKVIKYAEDDETLLEGAVFGLFTAEDISIDGHLLMKKDTLIEQRATDAQGRIRFDADLPVNFEYAIREITPPAGYACSDEVQTFRVKADAQSPVIECEFAFHDYPTVCEISKSSVTTGEELEGAQLQISDSNGNVIESWTSGTEPHVITGLIVGQEYTLTETLPASGYVTAESIMFTIENTGDVQKVEMKDDITKVQISKTDIAGKELEGAKLILKNEAGEIINSWVSSSEPHMIEMLPIGKYTLHEETAPNGYLVAEDITFEVTDTPEIQKVVMKDASETPTTPKTGDDRNPILWIGIAGLSLTGLLLIIFRNRRTR